jgi:hypothetical protein
MQAIGAELECRGDQSDEALCVTVRWLRMFTASELKMARFSNLDRAMLKERIILLGLR